MTALHCPGSWVAVDSARPGPVTCPACGRGDLVSSHDAFGVLSVEPHWPSPAPVPRVVAR